MLLVTPFMDWKPAADSPSNTSVVCILCHCPVKTTFLLSMIRVVEDEAEGACG